MRHPRWDGGYGASERGEAELKKIVIGVALSSSGVSDPKFQETSIVLTKE